MGLSMILFVSRETIAFPRALLSESATIPAATGDAPRMHSRLEAFTWVACGHAAQFTPTRDGRSCRTKDRLRFTICTGGRALSL